MAGGSDTALTLTAPGDVANSQARVVMSKRQPGNTTAGRYW